MIDSYSNGCYGWASLGIEGITQACAGADFVDRPIMVYYEPGHWRAVWPQVAMPRKLPPLLAVFSAV